MKLKNQITLIILGLAATTSLVFGQGQELAQNARGSIVGTWVVTRHGVDCSTGNRLGPDFPALMTFNQGGTLNAYAIPPNGSTPANSSPEYGTWVKLGARLTFGKTSVSATTEMALLPGAARLPLP